MKSKTKAKTKTSQKTNQQKTKTDLYWKMSPAPKPPPGAGSAPAKRNFGGLKFNPGAKHKLQARINETRALELRLRGDSYEMIAAKLNISNCGAHNLIARVLDREAEDQKTLVPQCRRLEIRRLDIYHASIYKKCKAGNLQAITVALKIQERRARLCGLDAALDIHHSGTVATVSVEAFRQMMTDANAKQIEDGNTIDIDSTAVVEIPPIPDGRKPI